MATAEASIEGTTDCSEEHAGAVKPTQSVSQSAPKEGAGFNRSEQVTLLS